MATTKYILVFIPSERTWGLVQRNWEPGDIDPLEEISFVHAKHSMGRYKKEQLIPVIKMSVEGDRIDKNQVARAIETHTTEILTVIMAWYCEMRARIGGSIPDVPV